MPPQSPQKSAVLSIVVISFAIVLIIILGLVLSFSVLRKQNQAGTMFSNLTVSASAGGYAIFNFTYAGFNDGKCLIDISTSSDMSENYHAGFGNGCIGPITVFNPLIWNKYTPGRIFYWRAVDGKGSLSPVQMGIVIPDNTFTNLSVKKSPLGSLEFDFTFNGNPGGGFIIYSDTSPDMTRDVYIDFGRGSDSPILVENPEKWGKYIPGRTLYWKVISESGAQSSIQTLIVDNPISTPSSHLQIPEGFN